MWFDARAKLAEIESRPQAHTGAVDMNPADILATASEYVTKDRAATHGDAESNFSLIGALWTAYTGAQIGAVDVAAMMTLFKVARIKGNPGHAENWIDAAGYAACGGEIATNQGETGK
jgi:hypothetical protein